MATTPELGFTLSVDTDQAKKDLDSMMAAANKLATTAAGLSFSIPDPTVQLRAGMKLAVDQVGQLRDAMNRVAVSADGKALAVKLAAGSQVITDAAGRLRQANGQFISATSQQLTTMASQANKYQLSVTLIRTAAQRAAAASAAASGAGVPGAPTPRPATPAIPPALPAGLGSSANLADDLAASLGKLALKVFAVKEAADLMAAAFKRGLNFNAETESITTAITAAIAVSQNVTDSTGKAATGIDRFNIAGKEAEKQMQALRAASAATGLGVGALAQSFQAAIGPGSQAGGGVDDLRVMAVRLTQAAKVLNLADTQLRSETREILSGNNLRSSDINTAFLHLTSQEIQQLRAKGELIAEINKRLAFMDIAGKKASETFGGTLSRFQATLSAFLGEGTKGAFDSIKSALQDAMQGVFDPSTGQIGQDFKGLAALASEVFGGVGSLIADGIRAAATAAKELSAWYVQHQQTLQTIFRTFGFIKDSVVSLFQTQGDVTKELGRSYDFVKFIRDAFSGVAVVVATIVDLMKGLGGVIGTVSGFIGALLLSPLEGVARVVSKLTGKDYASNVSALKESMESFSAASLKFGKEGFSFKNTRETIDKIKKEFAASPIVAIVTKPQLASGGNVTAPKAKPVEDKKKSDAADLAAQKALDDAQQKAAKDQAKAVRDIQRAELERDFAERLKTQQQYLEEKAKLDKDEIDAEIAGLEDLQAKRAQAYINVKGKANDASVAVNERKKIQAELTTIAAQIDVLRQKKVVIDITLSKESFQRTEAAQRLLEDISAQVLDAQGDTLKAKLAEIGLAEQRLLEDVRVRGDAELEAIVKKQADLKRDAAKRDQLNVNIDVIRGVDALKEDQIKLKREQGLITEVQMNAQLRAARLSAADALKVNIDQLEVLAQKSQDPRLRLQVEQLKQEYKRLAETQDSVAVSFNAVFFDSMRQGFKDLISGAKSFGDVMRTMLINILEKIAEIKFEGALMSLFGPASQGGGGGIGGAISNFISHFAGGGHVRGAGTTTSDSILAMLSDKEYVFKASAVEAIGVQNLDYMNKYGRLPGFATGGAVSRGVSGNPLSLQASPVNMNPILVLDADHLRQVIMDHPATERKVVHVAVKNGRAIQKSW